MFDSSSFQIVFLKTVPRSKRGADPFSTALLPINMHTTLIRSNLSLTLTLRRDCSPKQTSLTKPKLLGCNGGGAPPPFVIIFSDSTSNCKPYTCNPNLLPLPATSTFNLYLQPLLVTPTCNNLVQPPLATSTCNPYLRPLCATPTCNPYLQPLGATPTCNP